jgi:TorA maturation chaperone TorD
MNAQIATEQVAAAAEQDQLRAGTWNLLGNLLAAPPGQELLEALCQIDEPEGSDRDAMAQAWLTLRLAAERAALPALEAEYQDVFIGVGGGEVTPYASWYLTGSLMERPLVLLRQELEELGFEREEGVSDPEDHAGAICQIMGLLISDPEFDFERQRSFFQRHVEPWLGRLLQDVQQAPSAVFYRAVGGLGEEFLQLEQRFFSMLG